MADHTKMFGICENKCLVEVSPKTDTEALATRIANLEKSLVTLKSVYPVGSIYMSVNATNPKDLFGGTWVAWGSGRVPVGVNTSDGSFNTVEKTGGEKTHTLSENEMPSHNHGGYTGAMNRNYSGSFRTYNPRPDTAQVNGCVNIRSNSNTGQGTKWDGTDYYTIYGIDIGHEHSISAQGGSGAHNNLQPYITCYMWKRTA